MVQVDSIFVSLYLGAGETLELGGDTDSLGSENDLVGISLIIDLVFGEMLGSSLLYTFIRLIGFFFRARVLVAGFI